LVPNPITERAFARPRTAQSGRKRVLMVANGWDVRKNGEAALHAFALLSERLCGAELQVLGHDHGEGEAAQRWWRQSGLTGQVRFVGSVVHEQVLEAMAQSDVFMHAALEESFGAVLAEALAIGIPVVAGAESGAVPWVVGDAGCLVDVTQPESIAAALLGLLTDVTKSSRMALVGSHRVRSMFSAEAVTVAYEDAYEIARRSRARSIGAPA
jgi:glycosyltransferase involved in cell wall biosynthesis